MTHEEAYKKFSQFMKSHKCTDNDGGMGTNGGCKSLKLSRQEVKKLFRDIVSFWRSLEEQIIQ